MKKEEIIKQEIMGSISVYDGITTTYDFGHKEEHRNYKNFVVVDVDKLAKFLAKYVVKEDLIED